MPGSTEFSNMRIIVAATTATVALSLLSYGQPATKVPTGPAVGTVVPAFELPDQDGRPQSLRKLAGPKGTLLVIFRSADW